MNKKDTEKRQSDDSINKQNDIQPLGDTNTEDNFPHLNDTELRDLILLQYGQSYLDSVWDSVNEACSLKYAISVYTNNTNNIDNRHNINNIDKIQNSENKNDQKYIKNNGVRNNIKKDQEQHIKKHSNNHTNKENDKTLNKDGPNKETTSNRLLTLYHQNIPYIKGKIDITEDMLQDLLPDITLITEHGLKKEENGILKIDGYNLVGTYNRNSHKSGGCALLVKKDLHCEYIDKYNSYGVDFHFEFTAGKIYTECYKLIIICIYRSPAFTPHRFYELFERLLVAVLNDYGIQSKIIIAGDLNIDSKDENYHECDLPHLLQSFGLVNLVEDYTRITETSKTSIDYIITNLGDYVSQCKVLPRTIGVSDHEGQVLKFYFEKEPEISRSKFQRCFKQQNLNDLNNDLAQTNWREILGNINSLEDKWNHFIQIFKVKLDKHCPLRKQPIKNGGSHRIKLSETIKRHKDNMNINYIRFKDTGISTYKETYLHFKKLYKIGVRNEKKAQCIKKINNASNKSKTAWQLTDKLVQRNSRKSKHGSDENLSLIHEGETISEASEVANIFNNYFTSITTEDEQHTPNEDNNSIHVNSNVLENIEEPFSFSEINHNTVFKIIKNLPNKYSTGFDGISYNLIKKCQIYLIEPLVLLINESIRHGLFPAVFKLSKVVPVYKKKGCKKDVSNYRPIALTSTIGKIYEKVIYHQLISYLDEYKLLSSFQHGFRKKLSTTSALAEFIHETLSDLDSKKKVGGVFIDLSKAFDRVNIDILVKKLEQYGLSEGALKLMSSYLRGRKQSVVIKEPKKERNMILYDDICSETVDMGLGVPQGSILGPLCFLLYINNLKDHIPVHSEVIAYADDASFMCKANSKIQLKERCENLIHIVKKYIQDHNMRMNVAKTQTILFKIGNNGVQDNFALDIEGENIESSSDIKLLGITIDKNLTWKNHIQNISKKLSSSVYLLRRLSQVLDQGTLLTIYHATVMSHLSYAIEIWGAAAHTHLQKLFVIQKRAIRIIYGLKYRDSCKDIFKKESLLTLYSLYVYRVILFIRTYDSNKINLNVELNQHRYNLRTNELDLFVAFRKTVKSSNSVFIAGSRLYNKLPSEIRKIENLDIFRPKLKDYLISKSLYSLDELDCIE